MSEALPPRDTLKLADTPNAVGLARLHTTNVLSRWGVPAEVVETVKLIVSELTTNAVRHPKEAGEVSIYSSQFNVQTFELALEIDGDAVRVSVWDHDARPPVLTEPGVEATSGRGGPHRCRGEQPLGPPPGPGPPRQGGVGRGRSFRCA
ncbi:ATP-binding protein [Streptomyces sp. NPDC001770]